jgi:hypothetical protein
MATTKTTTLTLRIDPMIKKGLRLLVEKERRSLTNRMEVMIRDHCKLHNAAIPKQLSLLLDSNSQNNQD